ncbi:hypothetical protein AXA44_02665 [Rhodococcus sp. SC4]|nr:hypothetical protein AXA44_02665 [Rhodococcus sp. SC4]
MDREGDVRAPWRHIRATDGADLDQTGLIGSALGVFLSPPPFLLSETSAVANRDEQRDTDSERGENSA